MPARPAASEARALWCCLGAGFATLLDATTVAYTAPAVAETLDASTAGVQWFLASYSLTFGLGLVPAGRLGDAYGRRRLFVAGLLVFLVGALASAAAPAVWLLVAGRLAQGIGAGVVSAQVLGVIQDLFQGTARVRAFGAYTAAGASAAIVGPLLAGALIWLLPADLSWRLVLLLPVPFTVATIWLGLRGLPRAPRAAAPVALDLPGIALLGALVVIVTLPVIDPGMPAPAIVALVAATVLLAGVLVVWERGYARRRGAALFAPPLMRSPGYVWGNVVALLWFGSTIAASTVVTVFFLEAHGIPALAIALALIPSSLARMLSSRASPRLFGRLGPRLVTYGLALETACLLLVGAASALWDAWPLFAAVMVAQVVLGAAGGLVEPPLRAVTLGFSPTGLHGVAASFLQLTQRLSATFFVALTTGVLLSAGGATADSLRVAVLICAAASAGAVAASAHPALRAPGALPTAPAR